MKAERIICAQLYKQCVTNQWKTIALYRAFDGEISLERLELLLQNRDHQLCYPVHQKGEPLTFHQAHEWTHSVKGVSIPIGPIMPIDQIDVILVPGVAFTLNGDRLGLGGGHYDRTLVQDSWRGITFGVAFDLQLVEFIPNDPWDQSVDEIITEKRCSYYKHPNGNSKNT